ncbi:MAG: methyl-accepting chemotaxis protein [Pseudomonadota bacterium]
MLFGHFEVMAEAARRRETIEELSAWMAAEVGAVRTSCYEAAIDAAALGEASMETLRGSLDALERKLASPRAALADGMVDRSAASGYGISEELNGARVDLLSAVEDVIQQMKVCAGGSGGVASEDAKELRRICIEKMQPASTSFMILLYDQERENWREDLQEKQKYLLSAAGGIEQIATRINLIAINAAIEANRAGDSGAAFSVIAREIQDLAQRAKTATDEITRRIVEE